MIQGIRGLLNDKSVHIFLRVNTSFILAKNNKLKVTYIYFILNI